MGTENCDEHVGMPYVNGMRISICVYINAERGTEWQMGCILNLCLNFLYKISEENLCHYGILSRLHQPLFCQVHTNIRMQGWWGMLFLREYGQRPLIPYGHARWGALHNYYFNIIEMTGIRIFFQCMLLQRTAKISIESLNNTTILS